MARCKQADGRFRRDMGYDVNVSDALRISVTELMPKRDDRRARILNSLNSLPFPEHLNKNHESLAASYTNA